MTRPDPGPGHSSGHDQWNRRYQQNDDGAQPRAAAVLLDNQHLLPASGTAVDIACGRGGNALLLAAHGLETCAWDYADSALTQLSNRAREQQLSIHCECRDVIQRPPAVNSFDVITVSHFLDRDLIAHLILALRPGGLIFYQTFTVDNVSGTGPSNPAYRLAANELLELFKPLQVVHYHEAARIGDPGQGFRDRAQYIGYRRP